MPNVAKGQENPATVVWGSKAESNFVKAPRTLFRLGRLLDTDRLYRLDLKPRHLVFLLLLASHKYQNKPIRRYWEELARDMGIPKDTIRAWGYELQEKGLLEIRQNFKKATGDNRIGRRNDRNIFDISPFVRLVEELEAARNGGGPGEEEDDDG